MTTSDVLPTNSTPPSLPASIRVALEKIEQKAGVFAPEVGLILGSGLGALAESIREPTVLPYSEIPGFPRSHVPGHAGNLVLGKIGKSRVAALAGRAHLYEGWSAKQSTFPLRILHALGAHSLIVSNASGGINPRFHSGQVVLIDNHIDRIDRNPIEPDEIAPISNASGIPGRNGNPYDPDWMLAAQKIALDSGFALARGTYLATLGPTYETRSEYRMFEKMGADMVGMSTVPEVLLARHLGMKVLAFSIVTNVAKPDAPTKTEHSEVLDWSRQAQSQLIPLIEKLLS